MSGVGDPRLDLVLLVAVTLGAAAACALARRSRSGAHTTWLLFAAAIVAYGGTAIYRAVVPDAADRFPSAYDLGLLLFYPLALAALVHFVRSRAISDVQQLGVGVAIDDFGMGHSALSRLQTFPVDRLKIDKSFVTPLTHGTEGGSIAAAMMAMARSLDLLVVAEGVETQEHLAALRRLGCDRAQGYLFSKPVPATQITRLALDQGDRAPEWAQDVEESGPSAADAPAYEPLVRNLLAELQRLTGLETTYLTRIDAADATQRITHSRNTGPLDIPEGLTVNWSDTICRRALEQGVSYTDDVPSTFPDSQAGADLGLQTYVTVPLTSAGSDDIEGTLCGASRSPVPLGPETIRVMERFAAVIAAAADGEEPAAAVNGAG